MRSRAYRIILPVLLVSVIAGCSHGARSGLPPTGSSPQMVTPESVSPMLIAPAPMAKTAIQPSSAMQSAGPDLALTTLHYSQISGSASTIAASTDGSLWALSDQPSGSDKYIWHYVGTTWTNISGLAAYIAVAPDGTLYAANSGGGVYKYSSGTGNWTALGGGVSGITAGLDGSVYALSNGGSGADKAIWEYCCAGNPRWGQQPGSGVSLAGSWDQGGPYSVTSGTIDDQQKNSGGLFILNSAGAIWYLDATHTTFAQMSGGASAIAPNIYGGVFVLGYPANSSGNNIYYYDLGSTGWSVQPGAGVGLSTGYSNLGGSVLYVLGASGGIYRTPTTAISVLTGGGTSADMTASGGGPLTISPADNTYSGTVTFGANGASAAFYLTMAWGTLSQVSGNFTPGALPSSIGTALLYLDVTSSYVYPTQSVSFNQTPAVTVTTTGSFPGTRCGWAVYASMGGGSKQWISMTVAGVSEVAPSGNSFTVPAATIGGGTTVDLFAGADLYITPYCH